MYGVAAGPEKVLFPPQNIGGAFVAGSLLEHWECEFVVFHTN